MRYVSRNEAVEIDRRATSEQGIPILTLMENAGGAVAEHVRALCSTGKEKVSVLCGGGNNGGDGFVCARHLHAKGFPVTVIILTSADSISPESPAGVNFAALKEADVPSLVVEEIALFKNILNQCDIVVDAVFGTGLSRPPSGFVKEAIDAVNGAGKKVVAVDIPSGLDCDTGAPLGSAIKASLTVAMGFPKIGFRSASAIPYIGEVVVAEIYRP